MFCAGLLLARTRRILVDTQADIEGSVKRKRHPAHKFTDTQLRIAHEWHERLTVPTRRS